jgi:hypothetical protein
MEFVCFLRSKGKSLKINIFWWTKLGENSMFLPQQKNVDYYHRLTPADQNELRGHIQVFLMVLGFSTKYFVF